MPRKKKVKEQEEIFPIELKEPVSSSSGDAEILFSPCTCDSYPHDPNCPSYTVPQRTSLLAIIDSAPKLPDCNGNDFRHRLHADYEPQMQQFINRLKEFAECLP